MFHPREIAPLLKKLASQYPIITLTGPRQSGKTTLCKDLFPEKPYVSLEPLDTREFASTDPRGFLAQYSRGAILDEIQHVPSLFSYLQTEVDQNPQPGRFILTGSQHFAIAHGLSQSLAGRTGVLHLLPLGFSERQLFPNPPKDLFHAMFEGGYPRIAAQGFTPTRWLSDYVSTYIQKDVRQLLHVSDLQSFTTFVKLCAGRTAQELHLSAVGSEAGISHNTARAWLSVLEASFLCFRLPAWHRNLNKQLTKAPKLHFFDSGLLCYLLGIQEPTQIFSHPLRGAIFESFIVSEVYKARVHHGKEPNLFYFRESKGLEIDLLLEQGNELIATEIKSGATVIPEFFSQLDKFATLLQGKQLPLQIKNRLIYGGNEPQQRTAATVIPWSQVSQADW